MHRYTITLLLLLFMSEFACADYSDLVELLQYSNLSCGDRISNNSVQLVDLQDLLLDKKKAIARVNEMFPEHGLETPVPLLIEKAHVERRANRLQMLRFAVREAASRGCDLVILLDYQQVEKIMFRPQLMELKLKVSYVLVLFGSQVKNSARLGKSQR